MNGAQWTIAIYLGLEVLAGLVLHEGYVEVNFFEKALSATILALVLALFGFWS